MFFFVFDYNIAKTYCNFFIILDLFYGVFVSIKRTNKWDN